MELMKEESNTLSPCSNKCCLNVITAMSELESLDESLPAPPFAAMQRSSSDNMLAAVMDDMILRACVSAASSQSDPRAGWQLGRELRWPYYV